MAAASCPPAYAWANNSQGMDPCAVASKLIDVCNPGSPPLAPLAPYTSYPPPTREDQTSCTCSGPVYALVSACTDCQGGTCDSWSDWSHHCSHTFETFTPPNPDIMIPIWASDFNISTDPIYNSTYAQALASSSSQPQPGSTAISTPLAFSITSAAPLSSTTGATALSSGFSVPPTHSPIGKDISTSVSQGPTAILGSNQPTDQASSGSLKKSSKAGAIAGGVVGGLIFLAAIAAFLFWWLQRRRRLRTAPSAAYIAAFREARPPTSNSFRPGPFEGRVGSPHAYLSPRTAEQYRDEDTSTSTYSGGPLQQTTHYSNVVPEASLGGSRES